jgi:hypothetical protein
MSDDLVDDETLAGWLGVTGNSVGELAERCMIEPAGRSHARAEHTRSGRHRQRARVSWHSEALREIRDRIPRPEMRARRLPEPHSKFHFPKGFRGARIV